MKIKNNFNDSVLYEYQTKQVWLFRRKKYHKADICRKICEFVSGCPLIIISIKEEAFK